MDKHLELVYRAVNELPGTPNDKRRLQGAGYFLLETVPQ